MAEIASVIAICTSSRAGASMEQREHALLIAGVGIDGDRYALRTGWWSDPQWSDQELTLFEAEVAEAIGITLVEARRNIVTRGVRLDRLVGMRFAIGETAIVGVRACDPCRYLDELTGRAGLANALVGFNGGLRCHIEQGGWVRVGDAIRILGPVVE